jgi:predicted nucleic acid-binding protein
MNSEKSYIIEEEQEEIESLFFDSYAFFEILEGNKNYIYYRDNYKIITSKLNIFEIYFGVLRNDNESDANKILEKYYPFAVDFDEKVIADAAKLKMRLNKRDVSVVDCIGYSLALRLGVKFLTGDRVFEGMENVEFVV